MAQESSCSLTWILSFMPVKCHLITCIRWMFFVSIPFFCRLVICLVRHLCWEWQSVGTRAKWWGARGSKRWFKWSINLICRFLRQGSNPTMIWVHALNVNKLNWKIYFDGLYTIFFSFQGKLTTILLKFLKIFPWEM